MLRPRWARASRLQSLALGRKAQRGSDRLRAAEPEAVVVRVWPYPEAE